MYKFLGTADRGKCLKDDREIPIFAQTIKKKEPPSDVKVALIQRLKLNGMTSLNVTLRPML